MEWKDYLSELLFSNKDFEALRISYDNGQVYRDIPPIIRASIPMLEKMNNNQGPLNTFVFPEIEQSFITFVLADVLHSISTGEINSTYDPTGFTPGEKLKIGNAVVEYLGLEERNGSLCLNVKCADLDRISSPIAYLPAFQKTATQRRLSKYKQFNTARKEALEAFSPDASGNSKIRHIAESKTHLDKSVFIATTISSFKEQISEVRVEGKKITDLLYVAQTDYEGHLSNISPGQMSGIPAIVLSSDLYALNSALDDNPVLSVILDISNINTIISQVDALDELISRNIPIVCITDMADSFDLDFLSMRNFHVWRWNDDSITPDLIETTVTSSDHRTKNCSKHSVKYLKTEGRTISSTIKLLAAHRKETTDQTGNVVKLFDKLNGLTFNALRTTIPFSDIQNRLAEKTLCECETLLKKEEMYLSELSTADYSEVINNLREIYTSGYSFEKTTLIKSFLQENAGKRFVMIIPERSPKAEIQEYWYRWTLQHVGTAKLTVLLPSEYYATNDGCFDGTIICGWLKRAIMRKIIFRYITSNYYVLLYDYESKWQTHDSRKWAKVLNSSENLRIVERAFSTKTVRIATNAFESYMTPEPDSEDELGEIELILRDNKLKQYVNNSNKSGDAIVQAIPVSFVGGYLSFYRTGHKVISATGIISGRSGQIASMLPDELRAGDFVVIREADKDIIREIADIVLNNSGENGLRETAAKWREALEIELLFCTEDELYRRLREAGCTKGVPTIKRWISDEDIIAPQSRRDLEIIAEVTDNETLKEIIDNVYQAAQKVKSAHVLAGRKLSEQLRLTLAEELKNYGEIDPFNFWEPISIDIEGIGTVKVLKIIDIGAEVSVNAGDTNRLIEE